MNSSRLSKVEPCLRFRRRLCSLFDMYDPTLFFSEPPLSTESYDLPLLHDSGTDSITSITCGIHSTPSACEFIMEFVFISLQSQSTAFPWCLRHMLCHFRQTMMPANTHIYTHADKTRLPENRVSRTYPWLAEVEPTSAHKCAHATQPDRYHPRAGRICKCVPPFAHLTHCDAGVRLGGALILSRTRAVRRRSTRDPTHSKHSSSLHTWLHSPAQSRASHLMRTAASARHSECLARPAHSK
mmetsp:Transcript_13288/g.35728  ORF Transcript_13288/g.35728 Transcript_13288/m.35728 type:complete len:241 (-) Transcript_13288:263-985(-)